jgi:hypothetical protein
MECGSALHDEANFCGKCGAKVFAAEKNTSFKKGASYAKIIVNMPDKPMLSFGIKGAWVKVNSEEKLCEWGKATAYDVKDGDCLISFHTNKLLPSWNSELYKTHVNKGDVVDLERGRLEKHKIFL